tara:strand:- start:2821 stop:3603 length:783 start_codon:yes stop_codon:yes gene_type:complete
MLLIERGFKLTNDDCFCGNRGNQLKENKKCNVINYDLDHYDVPTLLAHDVNKNLLHIYNTKDVKRFSHIINDSFAVSQHLNIKYLILKNTENDDLKLKQKLKKNYDFTIKKLKSSVHQILFVKKFLRKINMNTDLTFSSDKPTNCDTNELISEYKVLFRDRSTQPISIKTDYDKIKFVASKLYSKLHIPIVSKDKRVDGKKIKEYALNVDKIHEHEDLSEYADKQFSKEHAEFYKHLKQIPNEYQSKLTHVQIDILKKGH